MSDLAPWTAKIDEATKVKLTELQKQFGGTANEMLQRLFATYDLQAIRDTMIDVPELQQLRYHLARSEEIVIEAVKCARDRELEIRSRIIELETALKDSRLVAQEASEKLEQVLKDSKDAIGEITQSLAREKESREEAVRIQLTLQRVLDTANAVVAELDAKAQQTDQALADLRDREFRLSAADRRVQDMETQLEKAAHLAEEVVALKNERDILQKAIDRFPLEKQEAVLTIEKRMLESFYALKDELASAREQFARVEMEKEREINNLRYELRQAMESQSSCQIEI